MDKSSPIVSLISKLLAGPARPGQAFTMPGANYDEVYRMGRRFRAYFENHDRGEAPVCLLSNDRAVMASALLASLAGGPELLVPYALSDGAISTLKRLTGFTVAIGKTMDRVISGITIVDGDSLEEEAESLAIDEPAPDRTWIHLFTGGSTGKPKLWTKTPANLLGEADFLVQRFEIKSVDRILATVSPLHIYGLLYSLLAPMVATARVVAETPFLPEEIKQKMAEAMPTIFVSVPPHYRALGANPPEKGAMRLAFSSAGPLPEEDGVAFSKATETDIVEIYGSTETGGVATRCRNKKEEGFTPYDCIRWRIAGEQLDIDSPFLSRELPIRESGWFTVSDRVKSHGSNAFLVTGRVDHIVKVGGNRVDLQRVRQVLLESEDIADALVLAYPVDSSRENEIVALLVGDASEPHIKVALEEILEPYELPRKIRWIDAIPRTAMGKIDGQAARRIASEQSVPSQSFKKEETPGDKDEDRDDSRHIESPHPLGGKPPAPMVRRWVHSAPSYDLDPKYAAPSLLAWLTPDMKTPLAADAASLRKLVDWDKTPCSFTLVVHEDTEIRRILQGSRPASLGIAVVLGTRYATGYLCNLKDGTPMAAATEDLFDQGADEKKHFSGKESGEIARVIDLVLGRCLKAVDASPEAVDDIVVCAGSAMTYALCSLPERALRVLSHLPVTLTPPVLRAGDLGLAVHPTVTVFPMPIVSDHIGGDTLSAVLADRTFEREETTLLANFGEQPAVVLGSSARLWSTGCGAKTFMKGEFAEEVKGLMEKAGIQRIDRLIVTGTASDHSWKEKIISTKTFLPSVFDGKFELDEDLIAKGTMMVLLDGKWRKEAISLCHRISNLKFGI